MLNPRYRTLTGPVSTALLPELQVPMRALLEVCEYTKGNAASSRVTAYVNNMPERKGQEGRRVACAESRRIVCLCLPPLCYATPSPSSNPVEYKIHAAPLPSSSPLQLLQYSELHQSLRCLAQPLHISPIHRQPSNHMSRFPRCYAKVSHLNMALRCAGERINNQLQH